MTASNNDHCLISALARVSWNSATGADSTGIEVGRDLDEAAQPDSGSARSIRKAVVFESIDGRSESCRGCAVAAGRARVGGVLRCAGRVAAPRHQQGAAHSVRTDPKREFHLLGVRPQVRASSGCLCVFSCGKPTAAHGFRRSSGRCRPYWKTVRIARNRPGISVTECQAAIALRVITLSCSFLPAEYVAVWESQDQAIGSIGEDFRPRGSPVHQAGSAGRSCSVRISRWERGNSYVLIGSG
jgi:hypothetical protein